MNKKRLVLLLAFTVLGTQGFARTICGVLDTSSLGNGNDLFSLTTRSGDNWELDPSTPRVASYLKRLASVHAESARVCVTGEVILHDEDKGNVFGVDFVTPQS